MNGPFAAVLLIALLGLAGSAVAARLPASAPRRLVVSCLAGAVMLHLLLAALTLAGIRWTLATAVIPLCAVGLAGGLAALRSPRRGVATAPIGWGDGLALLAILAFAAFASSRWIANPDFVYHWGLKGHRFLIAGGVDYAYLGRPWNWVIHPDYPNLLPELYAATSLLAGRWHEPAVLVLSPCLLALVALALRETLVAAAVPVFQRHAVVAAAALACAGFGIDYLMAGAADWLPALALAAALPALLEPPGREGDLELGVCAAFAAASKMEGMPLAAFLIVVQLGRYATARRWPRPGALAALTMPAALVVGHWLAMVLRHGLLQPTNAGGLRPQQLIDAWPAIRSSLLLAEWHGAPLLLLSLPLLLLRPRLRAFALVACLQLGFYLWSYAVTPVDPVQLVLTTFPRFALHLLPATGAAAAVAWLGVPARAGEGPPDSQLAVPSD